MLAQAVEVNAELAREGRRADASAPLVDTTPPQVETDDGETVPVEGLPETAAAHCRTGDRILGHWASGHFQAAAWMPFDLLPPSARDR